ncbi:MAG: ribosome-binding factor [Tepidiphilus sp.]|nr:30S ribosome-binding factor RbfA [Rhodocyclales bacterium]MDK2798168.1 ribosome-binding factor [Tepidiphilus sp.]
MKGGNRTRLPRVAEGIREELAELISRHVKDPRVGFVTLTAVEVSPDFAHAKVYVSTLADPASIPELLEGLQHAAGFLRRELGRRLRIHTIPQLTFVYDESIERGVRLAHLIDEAVGKAPEQKDAEGEDRGA